MGMNWSDCIDAINIEYFFPFHGLMPLMVLQFHSHPLRIWKWNAQWNIELNEMKMSRQRQRGRDDDWIHDIVVSKQL